MLVWTIYYQLKIPQNENTILFVHNEFDPLYIGFMHFSEYAPWMKAYFRGEILDNSTFDQTAVLCAVRQGVGDYWDGLGATVG